MTMKTCSISHRLRKAEHWNVISFLVIIMLVLLVGLSFWGELPYQEVHEPAHIHIYETSSVSDLSPLLKEPILLKEIGDLNLEELLAHPIPPSRLLEPPEEGK